jgi:hypothetical protein
MGKNLVSVARTRFHTDFYGFADDGARLDESYSYVAGRSNPSVSAKPLASCQVSVLPHNQE